MSSNSSFPRTLERSETVCARAPVADRNRRRLARLGLAVAATSALVACGGGGGGGGGNSSREEPIPVCNSLNSSSTGFAVGVCTSPQGSKLHDITAVVTGNPDDYNLNLTFPSYLPSTLSGPVSFAAANKTPERTRDVLGAIRGVAYENPAGEGYPYTALTSFKNVYSPASATQMSGFDYADFGTWERHISRGEMYVGAWYKPSAASTSNQWSGQTRQYSGWVVGAITEYRAFGDTLPTRANIRTYSFSAQIDVQVAADGSIVASGSSIHDLNVSYPDSTNRSGDLSTFEAILNADRTVFGPLKMQSIVADSIRDGVAAGDIIVPLASGRYELKFFGTTADPARELAGRFRFTTGSGQNAVASFAARAN